MTPVFTILFGALGLVMLVAAIACALWPPFRGAAQSTARAPQNLHGAAKTALRNRDRFQEKGR